jgi:anti-anti-sigma regulatory factor
LGMFVQLHQSCEARGVKLVFAEPPECMTMLFDLTGLDELFNVQASGGSS